MIALLHEEEKTKESTPEQPAPSPPPRLKQDFRAIFVFNFIVIATGVAASCLCLIHSEHTLLAFVAGVVIQAALNSVVMLLYV
jgi:hypothetical protein